MSVPLPLLMLMLGVATVVTKNKNGEKKKKKETIGAKILVTYRIEIWRAVNQPIIISFSNNSTLAPINSFNTVPVHLVPSLPVLKLFLYQAALLWFNIMSSWNWNQYKLNI